jgi:hypothetical protein
VKQRRVRVRLRLQPRSLEVGANVLANEVMRGEAALFASLFAKHEPGRRAFVVEVAHALRTSANAYEVIEHDGEQGSITTTHQLSPIQSGEESARIRSFEHGRLALLP